MRSKYNALPAVIVIFIAGLTVSTVAGYWQYVGRQKIIISAFEKEVNERGNSLYRELSTNFEALHSLSILFHGTQPPAFPVFSEQASKILTRHPHIQALEWIPKITSQNKARFIDRITPYFPDFQISERNPQDNMVPASDKDTYFPVYYVAPYTGNEKALGFDLSTNATRQKTLTQSKNSGRPLVTASITLVQEKAKQKGFLAFLPLYQGTTQTKKQRQQNLSGFVLGVYRVGDIFNHSELSTETPTIYMRLVDRTDKSSVLGENSPAFDDPVNFDIQYEKNLPDIWGRDWAIVASPTHRFISSKQDFLAEAFFFTGLILTLFICGYARFLILQKSVIEGRVESKTQDWIAAKEVADSYQQQLVAASKMASLGAMSAGIAHELSQPIGTILLKIHLMTRLLQKQQIEKAGQILDEMKLSALRAKKIMDSLRVISREGKNDERSLCQLNEIIDDTLTLFNDDFHLEKIQLVKEYGDDCRVLFSSVQLGQVIGNLVANARDAMEGVAEKQVTIRTCCQKDCVVLQIEDTGTGIPQEHQEKIFDPFFTSKVVGKGTGLGLPMCYSMIHDNHGTIEFHTEINKGTGFTVKLPKYEGA